MIDEDFSADYTKLYGLLQAMTPKERLRHARRAMSNAAKSMKREAERRLLAKLKSVRNPRSMRATIWSILYKGGRGFRITVAGNAHPYKARQRDLPLGRWLETGAEGRSTGSRGHRSAHATGDLPALGFLGETVDTYGPQIREGLEKFLLMELQKTARKYGCT